MASIFFCDIYISRTWLILNFHRTSCHPLIIATSAMDMSHDQATHIIFHQAILCTILLNDWRVSPTNQASNYMPDTKCNVGKNDSSVIRSFRFATFGEISISETFHFVWRFRKQYRLIGAFGEKRMLRLWIRYMYESYIKQKDNIIRIKWKKIFLKLNRWRFWWSKI
jgi:hypothetical protein